MRAVYLGIALCVVVVIAQSVDTNNTSTPVSGSATKQPSKETHKIGEGAVASSNKTSPSPAIGVRNRTRTGRSGGGIGAVPAPTSRTKSNATASESSKTNRTRSPSEVAPAPGPGPTTPTRGNRTRSGRTAQHRVCFPATSRVATPNGGSILMSELKVGDKVLTFVDGGVQEDSVYSFLHTAPSARSQMMRITADGNGDSALTLSPRHVLFTCDDRAVFAQDVKAGDCVQRLDDTVHQATVRHVEALTARGAFAPLTHSGKLFVDGILVSNYAELTWHHIIHAVFAPLRFVHRMMPWTEAPIGSGDSIHPYATALRTAFGMLMS